MLVKIYEIVRKDVYKLQYIYEILKRCVGKSVLIAPLRQQFMSI